jgi:predicted 2-oxoglutarate/Fe(II)-dependent dioxygenase YbiX
MHSAYFVEYGPESFTRIHTDDGANIDRTIVTLIQTSDNIEGGETLVWDTYKKKGRDNKGYVKRKEGSRRPIGREIIPVVVPLQDGESVIYDGRTTHGVAEVRKGKRLVLVNWYKKD